MKIIDQIEFNETNKNKVYDWVTGNRYADFIDEEPVLKIQNPDGVQIVRFGDTIEKKEDGYCYLKGDKETRQEQISELMSLLQQYWEKYPMLRFNQIINSLQRECKDGKYIKKAYVEEAGWGAVEVSYPDLFNVEDEDFIEFLQEKLKELHI